MIHYSHCPVCNSAAIQPALTAEDFTVSHERFAIWHCNDCTARFTQDVPEQDAIGPYYRSDTYISHSDTKKGLVNSLYHKVRRRTLVSKRKLITLQTRKAAGTILDIGCGTGAFLNEMQQSGWSITGLEPDATAREKANELYNIVPQESGKLFELSPQTFDAITMWHVLEHVHELQAYIQQIEKLLAPGGKLFIAVPNYTSYDAKVYAENWAAYDVPRHLYHFSPRSIENLLSTKHLALKTIKPMWFDSFYVSMLSEQYKNGKGNMFKACWNGLVSNLKAMGDKRKCSSVIYIIERKA
jgi:2-polyprenyl-3-methyl-5-hydroxy-6-metoxy-1,4-benzoquinol methylase